MSEAARHDAWQAGDSYDLYMGRWSRALASRFLDWLALPQGLHWLEVGCGTGALSAAILSHAGAGSLIAIDTSEAFLARARVNVPDSRVTFRKGDAMALDVPAESCDAVASGLVLNFVPARERALAEMRRVARPGAPIAFYVWDYPGGGVEFMRAFWDVAVQLDSAADELTEDRRFPFCTPEALRALAVGAGLAAVECRAIEVPTVFADFDDFWRPFTLGTGPAPGYCMSLQPAARERLARRLEDGLPRDTSGRIPLRARAWAVRGQRRRD